MLHKIIEGNEENLGISRAPEISLRSVRRAQKPGPDRLWNYPALGRAVSAWCPSRWPSPKGLRALEKIAPSADLVPAPPPLRDRGCPSPWISPAPDALSRCLKLEMREEPLGKKRFIRWIGWGAAC